MLGGDAGDLIAAPAGLGAGTAKVRDGHGRGKTAGEEVGQEFGIRRLEGRGQGLAKAGGIVAFGDAVPQGDDFDRLPGRQTLPGAGQDIGGGRGEGGGGPGVGVGVGNLALEVVEITALVKEHAHHGVRAAGRRRQLGGGAEGQAGVGGEREQAGAGFPDVIAAGFGALELIRQGDLRRHGGGEQEPGGGGRLAGCLHEQDGLIRHDRGAPKGCVRHGGGHGPHESSEPGQGRFVDGLMAGGGGVLAVAGREFQGPQINQMQRGVAGGGLVIQHRGGDFRAAASGNGDHHQNRGGRAESAAQMHKRVGDRAPGGRAVFTEVDQHHRGQGAENVRAQAAGVGGGLIDQLGQAGYTGHTSTPIVAAIGDPGFAVAEMVGQQPAVARPAVVRGGPTVIGRTPLAGGVGRAVAGEDGIPDIQPHGTQIGGAQQGGAVVGDQPGDSHRIRGHRTAEAVFEGRNAAHIHFHGGIGCVRNEREEGFASHQLVDLDRTAVDRPGEDGEAAGCKPGKLVGGDLERKGVTAPHFQMQGSAVDSRADRAGLTDPIVCGKPGEQGGIGDGDHRRGQSDGSGQKQGRRSPTPKPKRKAHHNPQSPRCCGFTQATVSGWPGAVIAAPSQSMPWPRRRASRPEAPISVT